MRKLWFVRTMIAMSLISAFLIGRPDAFAHAQPAGAQRTLAGTPALLETSYRHFFVFKNMITNRCIADFVVLTPDYICDGIKPQLWGFTLDCIENGNEIGTLQNLNTGACLDDSVLGLRAFACDVQQDDLRKFQQFKLTYIAGDHAYELQNLATGSCVDDSLPGGLRGNICNHTYFQKWL